MTHTLPLADTLQFGFMTGFANAAAARSQVTMAERLGYQSLWVGDHIAFPVPILDALTQLSFAAALSDTLTLGTCVYLLPLRHPTPVAKQVATLDLLTGGNRLVFGCGVGGEFANEYAACGVPVGERGARLGESIQVLKALWSGEEVSHQGRFFNLDQVQMLPAPATAGGPPLWTGGRSAAALARCGQMADGWVSYVVTPQMYRDGLTAIADAANQARRQFAPDQTFGTSHLLFARLGKSYEAALEPAVAHLSQRYGMDFRAATKKYAATGTPGQVGEKIAEFAAAGVRHLVLDMVGPAEERAEQLAWFAEAVMPGAQSPGPSR